MSEHTIPLNAREQSRLAQLKMAVDVAQQTLGTALGMAVDHANIEGTMTNLEFQGDHLVMTIADPPPPSAP